MIRWVGGACGAALITTVALLAAIDTRADGKSGFDWRVPGWAPTPVPPRDNPMSEEKVELGRHLFYDRRLSRDNTMSCGTCHQQARAFTDGLAAPVGVTGERHPRGAMSLANVGYLPVLTWANPNVKSLEQQALMPMFGEHPIEMGMAGREQELFARLRNDPRYPKMFAAAFPEQKGEISLATITKAIGAFQRALISLDAPYDRYRYGGDPKAISESAKRGEALFFSEKLECYHCHAGFTFTDNTHHSRLPFPEIGFHNNALYNVDGRGGYPRNNQGLYEFSQRPEDMGKFRTPTLRNIALTGPYMHDGSIGTLEEVLRHYAAAGRTVHAGEHKGNGANNPFKSNFIVGFELSKEELADVLAFLHSLTDERFVTDARFSDPFAANEPSKR
jgi:cytochrome c peroxidase